MHLLRIGLFGLRTAFFLHLRRVDHAIEQRCHINVILLLDISDDLLLDELLGPVSRDHLGVHDALEVSLGQPRLELSEGLNDVRLDLIHRDFIAEEQVQILDLDRPLVVAVDSTPHSLSSAAQFEDELGVFAMDPLLASQTRRHELRVVDSALLVEVHAVEQLPQLLLVGGDREQVLVLREGLLVAQRHQRVAELPVTPPSLSEPPRTRSSRRPACRNTRRNRSVASDRSTSHALREPTLFRWYATAVSAAFLRWL